MADVVEVYADVGCPFTHVGLRRFVARRAARGRSGVALHVRAWPLELVNGAPIDPALVAEEVAALRTSVAPELFAGFSEATFPASSRPAMALSAAAYRVDPPTGERVALALRTALFEDGRDVADPTLLAAVAAEHGVTVDADRDAAAVLAEWEDGRARGIRGSPEFVVGGEAYFCPALDIRRVDGRLLVTVDEAGMAAFLDACFAP